MSDDFRCRPDAPFHSFNSGKYKLLIKKVTHKFNIYEYDLVDADGKKYKAISEVHYAAGQLLQCMVSFKVVNARLKVNNTVLCKEQDLATPIHEGMDTHTESNPKAHFKPQLSVPTKLTYIPTQYPFIDGSPRKTHKTGSYRLTVEMSMSWDGSSSGKYLYLLVDVSGLRYHSISDIAYPKGTKLVCRVEVLKTQSGDLFFVAISDDDSSKSVCMINRKIVLRKNYLEEKTTQKPIASQAKPKKEKVNATDLRFLRTKYKKGERYLFTVTGERDNHGYQLLRDPFGYEHPLIGTTVNYAKDDEVRCTVREFSLQPNLSTGRSYLILTSPKIVNKEDEYICYVKSPSRWHSEVQGLGKHKCGKAFKCSCCGRDFPANAGVRVDMNDIYFCNSCARKIYNPEKRGNHHVYIPTPMGNKR